VRVHYIACLILAVQLPVYGVETVKSASLENAQLNSGVYTGQGNLRCLVVEAVPPAYDRKLVFSSRNGDQIEIGIWRRGVIESVNETTLAVLTYTGFRYGGEIIIIDVAPDGKLMSYKRTIFADTGLSSGDAGVVYGLSSNGTRILVTRDGKQIYERP
jgi:hypothetical protein